MKTITRKWRKWFAIPLAVALSLSLMLITAPAVYAANEGSVPGSFAIGNAAPIVTSVELYEDASLLIEATDITPLTTYYAKVTVSDANWIDDIDEVELQLFYDAAGSDELTAPGSADTKTNAIFTWTKGGDFVMTAMPDTTWVLDNVAGASAIPADMEVLSDSWVFAFKAGKVATESSGTPDWDMYAKATDTVPTSGELYTYDKELLWYGEVEAVTADVSFGTVALGSGFDDNVNEVGGIAITYIANGLYAASVKATSWDGLSEGPNAATYDDTGTTLSAEMFSLKAFTADTWGSAVQVTVAGAVVDNSGTITVETGDVTTTNTLWLKIAASFTTDTYSGDITYVIGTR